jgi:hypothetical protein
MQQIFPDQIPFDPAHINSILEKQQRVRRSHLIIPNQRRLSKEEFPYILFRNIFEEQHI